MRRALAFGSTCSQAEGLRRTENGASFRAQYAPWLGLTLRQPIDPYSNCSSSLLI